MQTNEHVVVIQGDATKWYSQVVFIMNPKAPSDKIPVDFVAEAEQIIFSYMAKKRRHGKESIHAYLNGYTPPTILIEDAKAPKKRFRFEFLFYILMIVACIAMAAIIAAGWPS